MSKLINPKIELLDKWIGKVYEAALDSLAEDPDLRLKKLKTINQKAARKRAKGVGLFPIVNAEAELRKILNEKIINEVRKRKLTHITVAGLTLTCRPKITRIMNQNLKKISTDFMLRVLSTLGVEVTIGFNTNQK